MLINMVRAQVIQNNRPSEKILRVITAKIHLTVDSYSLSIEFTITGGEVHDSKQHENLLINCQWSKWWWQMKDMAVSKK